MMTSAVIAFSAKDGYEMDKGTVIRKLETMWPSQPRDIAQITNHMKKESIQAAQIARGSLQVKT